jgi:hypothetical protein
LVVHLRWRWLQGGGVEQAVEAQLILAHAPLDAHALHALQRVEVGGAAAFLSDARKSHVTRFV